MTRPSRPTPRSSSGGAPAGVPPNRAPQAPPATSPPHPLTESEADSRHLDRLIDLADRLPPFNPSPAPRDTTT